MVRELAETVGDQSNNFSFVSFFPASVKEQIEPIVDMIHTFAVNSELINKIPTSVTGTMLDKTTIYERKKYLF